MQYKIKRVFSIVIIFLICISYNSYAANLNNYTGEKNKSELHIAVEKGDLDQVKSLITSGADIEIKTSTCSTPLLVAVRYSTPEHIEIIKYLIERGADINVRNNKKQSATSQFSFSRNKIRKQNRKANSGVTIGLNSGITLNINSEDAGGGVSISFSSPKDPDGNEIDKAYYKLVDKHDFRFYEKKEKALYESIKKGNLEEVKNAIETENICIESVINTHGYTPLHWAIFFNKNDIVKYLIDKGADISANTYNDGYTPIVTSVVSAHKPNLEAFEILLSKGVNTDTKIKYRDEYKDLLQLARQEVRVGVANLLKKYNHNVDLQSIKAIDLHLAATSDDLTELKLLLTKQENLEKVNSKDDLNYTPLHWAVYADNLEAAKLLYSKGGDFFAAGGKRGSKTPLNIAVERGNIEMMKYILDTVGLPPVPTDRKKKKRYYSPLNIGAVKNQVKAMETLIEYGADLTEKRLLANAFSVESFDAAKFLIKKGANLDITVGRKPLIIFVAGKRKVGLKFVKLLEEKGVSLDFSTEDGVTPLFRAAYEGNASIVKYLLEKGLDTNLIVSDGSTPLHGAVMAKSDRGDGEYVETVKLLMKHGADTTITDNEGKTVMDRINPKYKTEFSDVFKKYKK